MPSVRWSHVYEFACHTAACRPPTSGGTGGSTPGRSTLAITSPHYQKRSSVDKLMTEADALALVRDKDATGRRILDKGHTLADGQVVGVRANLNVKKTTGITVQTMHAGTEAQLKRGTGMFAGEAVGYGAAVTLHNVNFSVNQVARHKIATGQANKFPMASVDGKYVAHPDPATRFDGVELRFNPMRSHLFTDPDGRAVKSASEATVVGSQVFVRGKITYYGDKMPKPVGDVPTEAHA